MSAESSTLDTKNYWWAGLAESVMAVVLGLLLLTAPSASLVLIVQIMGIFWLAKGLYDLVSLFVDRKLWFLKLISGVLGVFVGLLVLQHPLYSGVLVPAVLVVILGIQGIVAGLIGVVEFFKTKKWGTLVMAILSVLLGLILVFNAVIVGLALPTILGVVALLGGIVGVFVSIKAGRDLKKSNR